MAEQERHIAIDAETLAGHRFPYQEDVSLIDDVDLMAATPGQDINWLEDVELLEEEGVPAVFDRYSNSFLRIYFPIPEGRENEIARKVLIKHLQSGNSYGIQLKPKHCKFPQPELGPWVAGSATVGTDYIPGVTEERSLARIERLLERHLENPIDSFVSETSGVGHNGHGEAPA